MQKLSSPLKRVPSDLLQLISDGSSLSLPYDTSVEPLLVNKNNSKVQKTLPLITRGQLSLPNVVKSPIIMTQYDEIQQTTQRNGGEKKRVRFHDT